ncbi:MAG: hypothetical protein ACJ78Q_13745 [Chloroflexia bacterium]
MTLPDPSVSRYIAAHFVPFSCDIETPEHRPIFRANHIIWTPSAGFADRNGSMHYHSPGFLPPSEFLSALAIGRARCLMAWTRSAEAAHELESASTTDNTMTPEVLFWLSVAYFLERRDSTRMYEVWQQISTLYPDSPWAKRTYSRG